MPTRTFDPHVGGSVAYSTNTVKSSSGSSTTSDFGLLKLTGGVDVKASLGLGIGPFVTLSIPLNGQTAGITAGARGAFDFAN
jgi:hypothetical protein